MREAGLPPLRDDTYGEQALLTGAVGVVRAIYPETHRVDIETDNGSFLTQVLVLGPYMPELHTDGDAPSHVGYLHVAGQAEAFCWPMPHRRLLGPRDTLKGEEGQSQPERRYFHTHGYILRWGKVTVRIADDHRWIVETEEGDFILLDTDRRTVEVQAPTVFIGTDDATRMSYERDKQLRLVMPKILIGDTALPDKDGITYIKDTLLHLISPDIKLGSATAAQQLLLGNLFQTFLNTFLTLYNTHVHGTSGTPSIPTPLMPNTTLSTIARLSA